MSCEGNRHKFLGRLAAIFPELDATELERIYQSAKAAGVQEPGEETEKTRRLFADMQSIGIKPPTHSPDGLPKPASRAGYAALYDAIIANARVKTYDRQDYIALMTSESADARKHLKDAMPWLSGYRYRENEQGTNAAGYRWHYELLVSGSGDSAVWEDAQSVGKIRESIHQIVVNDSDAQGFYQDFQPDADGFYPDGYDQLGFDRDGFDSTGFSLHGIHRDDLHDLQLLQKLARRGVDMLVWRPGRKTAKKYRVDVEGFAPDGYMPQDGDPKFDRDRFGFNRLGFRDGRSWTGYDENGLDANGQPAPKRKGFDAWGYSAKDGLTAPDDQGRRYNVIGWIYDPNTNECYDPHDVSRRMPHTFKRKKVNGRLKVVLEQSWSPSQSELIRRMQNPRIRLQEARQGAPLFRYGTVSNIDSRRAMMHYNAPYLRYLRSPQRAQRNPSADFMGIPLRCPKCGQFIGARPHVCPAMGQEKIVVLSDGAVIAWRKGVAQPSSSDFRHSPHVLLGIRNPELKDTPEDVFDRILDDLPSRYTPSVESLSSPPASDEGKKLVAQSDTLLNGTQPTIPENRDGWAPILRLRDLISITLATDDCDETAVLLENPHRPDFDPDFEGGPLCGFHWRSGLTRDGYDWTGLHYLTRRSRDGLNIEELIRQARLRKRITEWEKKLEEHGKKLKDALERTYSAIATSMAGAARRVSISEEGGPRSGMFWTDMRGHIQAEMYPLGREADKLHNLVALKAGIYHELGHEEDTPVGIFRRVVDIAQGKEDVPGLPREAAGLVPEIYNILEDGRMERSQAKKRRGVAAVLAEDAKHNPRWDEIVGDQIPVSHQLMGMMLYRALPFFRVRQEVLDAAPPRVRKLFNEVRPLVDRAMRSPEDTFAAAIEISRKLVQDADMKQFARQMTQQQSWGGKWTQGSGEDGGHAIIISGMPHSSSAQADNSIPIPMPGWGEQDDESGGQGRRQGAQQDDQPGGQGRRQGAQQDDQPGGQGRRQGARQDDQSDGQGRRQGAQQDDQPGGQGRRQGAQQDDQPDGQGVSPGASQDNQSDAYNADVDTNALTSEPDEAFFNNLADAADMTALATEISADVKRGGVSVLRSPVGRQLQAPSSQYDSIHVDMGDDQSAVFEVYTPLQSFNNERAQQVVQAIWQNARGEGQRIARRLETLREQVREKTHLQTSGSPDRRRFKRAVTGSRTTYRRNQLQDITSLAVSIQLDMSGSMRKYIAGGQLAGATIALGAALDKLDANWMVAGFGSEYRLFKSFGDQQFTDEQASGLALKDLGGTDAAPGFKLGLEGLKEQPSANKLHVMMTDGELFDAAETRAIADEMKTKGILPFGIFFGDSLEQSNKDQMDYVFGAGNWVHVQQLSDMSEVVAKRIERIYRRILATR